jgi:hypothetical protein
VIATGFDHVKSDRSTPAAAPMQTPVDMTAYSSLRPSEPAPSVVQPRPTIARRPSLEMPLVHPNAQSPRVGDPGAPAKAPVAVGQTGDIPLSSSVPGEFDLNLELDVPAFLRRNEG